MKHNFVILPNKEKIKSFKETKTSAMNKGLKVRLFLQNRRVAAILSESGRESKQPRLAGIFFFFYYFISLVERESLRKFGFIFALESSG